MIKINGVDGHRVPPKMIWMNYRDQGPWGWKMQHALRVFLTIRLDRFPSVIGTFFDAEVPDGLV